MNYVGQLAETVFGTVKELYRGLNPATLSGGIDVLVVKQADGSFRCSPFHVRFGKLGVLRSREKVVDIEINGEPVDLHMKLGDSGEAFFVQELDSDEPGTAGKPEGLLVAGAASVGRRRRRRCRKKARRKEDAPVNSSSEEVEAGAESEPALLAAPWPGPAGVRSEGESSPQPGDIYPYSDGEWAPQASLASEGLESPKSDSELELRALEPSSLRAESHMQWAWGRLPKVAKAERPESSTILEGGMELASPLQGGPSPSSSCGPGEDPPGPPTPQAEAAADLLQPGTQSRERGTVMGPPLTILESEKSKTLSFGGAGLPVASKSWSWTTQESPVATRQPEGCSRETGPLKKSQHLGPSDIYLDDLPSLDSEDAALYFPNSDCELGARRWSEPSSQKLPRDPSPEPTANAADTIALSLCGGLAHSRDISTEKFNQHLVSYQDLVTNPGLLEDPNLVVKVNEKYYNWAVAAPMLLSLQAFQKNLPKSTVDKLEKEKMPRKGGRWWFSWRRRDFPAEEPSAQRDRTTGKEPEGDPAAHRGVEADHGSMEAKAGAAGNRPPAPMHPQVSQLRAEPSSLAMWAHAGPQLQLCCHLSSEDDDGEGPDSPVILEALTPPSGSPVYIPTYKKSLRLSSSQIRRLNLLEGANDVVFSVTTQYQGTCRCKATIYLWKWNDKVVISDIDGTITKSDALGHILPQLGKDWTHQGITSLYHKIHLNGYKFLYCSARAIGMANLTKGYLQWVNERGCGLPKGPILLSPSSLFSALHREVIEKKPETFKIACLSDIRQLFLPQAQPFYAAFGNRPNDVLAYRQVGLPEARIFTVNPRGELIQELLKNHKSTYQRLSEAVEFLFPPVARGPSMDLAHPEYSSFCYWREPLPAADLNTLG